MSEDTLLSEERCPRCKKVYMDITLSIGRDSIDKEDWIVAAKWQCEGCGLVFGGGGCFDKDWETKKKLPIVVDCPQKYCYSFTWKGEEKMKELVTIWRNDRGIIDIKHHHVKMRGDPRIEAMYPDVMKPGELKNCEIFFVDGGFVIDRVNQKEQLWITNNTIHGVMRSTKSGKLGFFGNIEKADAWYALNQEQ